jgi:hypothetical protein
MSFEQYGEILARNDEERRRRDEQPPISCPNDHTPLQAAEGGQLHCPFDGWTWPQRRILGD